MYENMTYEFILDRVLNRVKSEFDKREGSIIYDASAPIAFEMAEAYIMAQVILQETFATTANREFLELRAAEYNIYPEPATKAELKGKFSSAVPIGSRFNYDNYNFVVTKVVDDNDHTYVLECEQPGRSANTCIGDLIPLSQGLNLSEAKTTELLVPGEDEEDTETFRSRYISTLKSKAYGGNGQDYLEKVKAIKGVGGCKVYRCWNGGGTVKVVIIDTEFKPPSSELIGEVQQALDPTQDGKGYGVAPIGHVVTVAGAKQKPIDLNITVTPISGTPVRDITDAIKAQCELYLSALRKDWSKQNEKEVLTIRTAYILSNILTIQQVKDCVVRLPDDALKQVLATDEIPVLGNVTITEG